MIRWDWFIPWRRHVSDADIQQAAAVKEHRSAMTELIATVEEVTVLLKDKGK